MQESLDLKESHPKLTLTPLPFGKLIHGFSWPMMKTLFSRVANEFSMASLI
jgi:hypothetical protein